ncbi:MAG: hypothetical protein ACRCRW_15240 [Aeromonadaceae bacterium]
MGVASDTYAKIIRQQYDDWKTRFYPKQQALMGLATDNSLMNDQLNRAGDNTVTAIKNAQVAQSNQMARMGVATSTDANDNSLGLKTALATAGAKNGIRSAEQDRQMSILSGASYGLKSSLNVNTPS